MHERSHQTRLKTRFHAGSAGLPLLRWMVRRVAGKNGVKCVAVKTALRMLPAKKRQVRCQSALSEATHVTGGASRRRCAAGSLFPCPPLREEAMSVHISCVSLCCAPNARQRNVAYGKVPNARSKIGRRWRPFALHARRGSSVYEAFWRLAPCSQRAATAVAAALVAAC